MSPYRDLHSRNPSTVSNQFVDKFDNIKINSKVFDKRNGGSNLLSHNASQDQFRSDSSNLPIPSKAVLNMKFDGSVKSSIDNKSVFDLQSAQSLSY